MFKHFSTIVVHILLLYYSLFRFAQYSILLILKIYLLRLYKRIAFQRFAVEVFAVHVYG